MTDTDAPDDSDAPHRPDDTDRPEGSDAPDDTGAEGVSRLVGDHRCRVVTRGPLDAPAVLWVSADPEDAGMPSDLLDALAVSRRVVAIRRVGAWSGWEPLPLTPADHAALLWAVLEADDVALPVTVVVGEGAGAVAAAVEAARPGAVPRVVDGARAVPQVVADVLAETAPGRRPDPRGIPGTG